MFVRRAITLPWALVSLCLISGLATAGSRADPEISDPAGDTRNGFTGEPAHGAGVRNIDLVSVWFEAAPESYEIHVRVNDLTTPDRFRDGVTVHFWRVMWNSEGFTFVADMFRDILGMTFAGLDVVGISESAGAPNTRDGTAELDFHPTLDEIVLTLPRTWTVRLTDGSTRTFTYVNGTVLADSKADTFEGIGSRAGACNFPCIPIDTTAVGKSFTFATGGGDGGGDGGEGDKEISSKALVDHDCEATEWHFVINQIDDAGRAPATILVVWTSGASQNVTLASFTGGVAHYTTSEHLDTSVSSATARIYADWSGQFNLSHGPCDLLGQTLPPDSDV